MPSLEFTLYFCFFLISVCRPVAKEAKKETRKSHSESKVFSTREMIFSVLFGKLILSGRYRWYSYQESTIPREWTSLKNFEFPITFSSGTWQFPKHILGCGLHHKTVHRNYDHHREWIVILIDSPATLQTSSFWEDAYYQLPHRQNKTESCQFCNLTTETPKYNIQQGGANFQFCIPAEKTPLLSEVCL